MKQILLACLFFIPAFFPNPNMKPGGVDCTVDNRLAIAAIIANCGRIYPAIDMHQRKG
jgi:hypothetical protein